ncbi:hypothetical protein TrRE_jg3207 [Triparma retinervis]|uniref:Uncharacterized protein n=1 Tax=Triparma retinervis TaxID=2557542 RepID=A0A9W6ZA79_9STRA|nr:hypothetical protein TrRE_jg3207 [Triparma retinervis]
MFPVSSALTYTNARGRELSYFSLSVPVSSSQPSPSMMYKPNGVFSERILNPITISSTGDARISSSRIRSSRIRSSRISSSR